jgi:hypothetical protein
VADSSPITKLIVFLSTLWLAILLVRTEPPVQASEAPSASTASVTQVQAQQALEVLQDEKKRAALIETLQTMAKLAPSASAPASTSPLPLQPTSLGAEILVQLSDGITRLANEFAATARAVTEFPILWRWLVHEITNPAARAELLDASWKLTLVVGRALGAEWLTLRAIRQPLTALESRAPSGGGTSQDNVNGRLAAAERPRGRRAGMSRSPVLGGCCGACPWRSRGSSSNCSLSLSSLRSATCCWRVKSVTLRRPGSSSSRW